MEKLGTSENLIDRDRRSDVLAHLMVLGRNIQGFDGKTVDEVFTPYHEHGRRELLQRLSGEEYCQLLEGVNGVLRNKEKTGWNMDGDGVTAIGEEVVGNHIFPKHIHKKEIILESWSAAQRMNAENRSMEDIGMLLGSLLVETHPFADGNGRVSRFLYTMVRDGYNEERLKAVLGEDGREEGDMALSKRYIDDLFIKNNGLENPQINKSGIVSVLPSDPTSDSESVPFGKLSFPNGVSKEIKETIIEAGRNDGLIFTVTLSNFFNENPEIQTESCVKSFGERRVLLLQNLLSILSANKVNEFAQLYWKVKKEYVKGMIDIFENPDKEEYMIERGGDKTRILDFFKERLASKTMLI